jgi:hypothetical protein
MVEQKTVDIRSGRVFPLPFLVLGAAIFIAGVGVFAAQPFISIALLLVAVLIFTSYEGTEINPALRTYREYNSILFIKKGKQKKYDSIEKIFINSGTVSQKVYTAHTSTAATFSSIEYNAYLKFTEGVKVFLFSEKNKSRLLKRLHEISRSLNTPVVDNTVKH